MQRSLSFVLMLALSLTACLPAKSTSSPTGIVTQVSPADTQAPAQSQIRGLVWHDLCAVSGGEGGEAASGSEGCVQTPDGAFQANGLLETGEPGIAGVVVDLGNDACPSMGAATATTDVNGQYHFDNLSAGKYCVSIDPQGGPNGALLIPGMWTVPSTDLATIDVSLAEGEDKTGVDFGWDYQFLPEPEAIATPPAIDPSDFEVMLTAALSGRDFATVRTMMGDPFYLAFWQSEGGPESADFVVEQLGLNQFVEGIAPAFESGDDLAARLGFDPLTIFPDVKAEKAILVSGLGPQMRDQGIIVIARRPEDNSLYWYGFLLAKGGFTPQSNPGGTQIGPDTFFTSVKYVLANSDAPVYAGAPGDTSEQVSTVAAGQTALVTGVNLDGSWWRVLCPGEKIAACWVSADLAVTQPSALEPGTQIAPGVLETDVRYASAGVPAPIYSGEPGDTSSQVGEIAPGMAALVTGVSVNGQWWRVVCPDDTVGSCWVSANPMVTTPAWAP